MVLPDSHRIPRVPRYLGDVEEVYLFRLQGFHPLWPVFPGRSARNMIFNSPGCSDTAVHDPTTPFATRTALHEIGLGCSPFARHYLAESLLFSFPPVTKMFQFTGLPSLCLCIQYVTDITLAGLSPFGNLRIKAC